MKYTLNGFSQQVALSFKKTVGIDGKQKVIKIDCTDLTILRWFVDFYPNMRKMSADGKEYAWLSHKKLQEDLPILDISKRSCIDRMQKLVEFEILEYKCLKEGGTFSLYRFGKNYERLISSNAEGMQSNVYGSTNDNSQGMQSNVYPVCNQPTNKDITITYSSNKDTSNKDIYNIVISYLNDKTGLKYKATSKATRQHIHARIEEGFTVEDFKTVIDKKCADWVGTEWEQYLRPSTLFGTKFESYLNAPVTNRKTYGQNGVEINPNAVDDLAGIL